MSQSSDLLFMFVTNGHKLTLAQLMQPPLGREHSARMSELRKQGYRITCERKKNPGENVYRLTPPDGEQMRFY